MKNEIFDNMLSRYDLTTEQHKRNAIFEVNQQMILAGLYAGGFFCMLGASLNRLRSMAELV